MRALGRFLLALLLLGAPVGAGEPPVLIRAEFDARTFERGLRSLALATLLDDAQARKCFAPLAGEIGLDPRAPVESLIAAVGPSRFFEGRATLEVFSITFEGGLMVRAGEKVPVALLRGPPFADAEFVLSLHPGPALRQLLARRLLKSEFGEVEVRCSEKGVSSAASCFGPGEPGPEPPGPSPGQGGR